MLRRLIFSVMISVAFAHAASATEVWVAGDGDGGSGSSILYSAADGGGWESVYSNEGGSGLTDIQFALGTTIGWAVGGTGEIVRHDGEAWAAQSSGSISLLYQVAVCDELTAWTAGTGGTILRTIDGGSNWTGVSSPTSNSIISISAVNAYHAWVLDSAGALYRTTNQGEDWTPLELPSEVGGARTVSFQSWEEGGVVGFGGVAVTEDEGDSWQVVGTGTGDLFPRVVANVEELVVIANYRPDGSPDTDELTMNVEEGEGWIGLSLGEGYTIGGRISQPSFISRNEGWVPALDISEGPGGIPVVLRTTNAGETFEEMYRSESGEEWSAVVAVPEPSLVLLQIAALGCTAWLRIRRRETLSP